MSRDMSNRFLSKLSIAPSGVVKLSRGLGNRKSMHSCVDGRPPLSIVPNFKTPLAVSSPQGESEAVKRGWGSLGFKSCMSRKSSVNLRERMCAVELEYGIGKCYFVTLTLPSDNPAAYIALARWSSYAINRLSVWLSDNYSGYDFARVGVWEYQKRGALHYHLLLGSHCMDAIKLESFRCDIATAWMHILESIEEKENTRMFEQRGKTRDKSRLLDYDDLGQRFANVQIVEKSVCAYLSEYLAGSNHDNGKDKNRLRKKLYPIATWGQWNRRATQLYKKYSVECEQIIWASKYDAWTELATVLFGCIERAENTTTLTRGNPWWESTIAISRNKGLRLIELANEWLDMVRVSGIACGFKDVFKAVLKKTERRDYILDSEMHSLDFEEYLYRKDIYDGYKAYRDVLKIKIKLAICPEIGYNWMHRQLSLAI